MLYDEVIDNLQNLIKRKPTQGEIAKILGVGQSAVASRKNRQSDITFEELRAIESAYGVLGQLTNVFVVDDSCVKLDYFADVWASCGTGAKVFEETAEKINVAKDLISNYSANKKYSVINSRGDSMTPFIQEQDKLIVEHWAGGQIVDNCVYVFRFANELFVKRLVKNVTQIVIKSDNKLYEPIIISDKDEEFEIIGRVVGLMRDMR